MIDKDDHPPILVRWLLSCMDRYEGEFSITGDCSEEYKEIAGKEGKARAVLWVWRQAFSAIPSNCKRDFIFGGTMLKNYLKIAYRNFMRHKLFSFINVSGLAIGLSVCMLIGLWVQRELSYDRFHEKADRIYRVERELFRENAYSIWPICGGRYKQALIDDFPEIENAVRFWRRELSIKDHKGFVNRQELFAADNSVFEIFDFGLAEGDERTALVEPWSVVLTPACASKYLGTRDPVGRSITVEWEGEDRDFEVTGVLTEVPKNSHIHFEMLMSISSYPPERFESWRSNYLYTYVLIGEDASKPELEAKLKGFVSRRLEPHYGDLLNQNLGIHEVLKMELFPLIGIHLHPRVNWEVEPGGNMTSVTMFLSIAALILIIACINFVNLSTARAGKRAKEVSLRKTVGAGRSQLRGQFLQESVLLVFLSLFMSFGLSAVSVAAFNRIFGEEVSLSLVFQPHNLAVLIGAAAAVGVLAGLYPAFYLTRFEPAHMMKGSLGSGGRKSSFRRNMVIFQFIISTALIIGMLTVYKQMRYVQTRSLGFDKENVVTLPVRSEKVVQGYEAFRNQLLADARIDAVSASSEIPGDSHYGNGNVYHRSSGGMANLIFFSSDYDYLDTYRMKILAGRNFSRDLSTDEQRVMLLNEAAVIKLGWTPEKAVGKKLEGGFTDSSVEVVGVVKNFNFKSLRREVEPMALFLIPEYITDISIRILPGDMSKVLRDVQRTWERTFPGEQFEFSFMDSRIDRLYENDLKMQRIFLIFAALSIFVACLGLFGLASFTAEVKTKEIGIRKALGASSLSITLLFSKEFVRWILLANIAAWPLAWFFMNRWLRNFAYRDNMGWFVFALSAILTLLIAAVTFGGQALKAAHANPVESLRYE